MSTRRSALLLVTALASVGCRPSDGAEPAHGEDEHAGEKKGHQEGKPGVVKLEPSVVQAARIRAVQPNVEPPGTDVVLYGEIAADPDRTARVTSPVAGRLESVSFREGDVVVKGTALAVVRVPELGRLRGAEVSASARARAARANVGRLAALAKDRLGTEQALADARAELEIAEAEAASLGGQLRAVGQSGEQSPFDLTLRAPRAGVVTRRSAVAGGPVSAQEPIATIVDLGEVVFVARVPERQLPHLAPGATAQVEVGALGRSLDGRVEAIAPELDPRTRTASMRVRVASPGTDVRLGLFGAAHVHIRDAAAPARALVPRSALVEIEGRQGVFVEVAEGEYRFEALTLGPPHGAALPVLAGLAPSAKVVVDGAFSLKGALLRSTLEEDEH